MRKLSLHAKPTVARRAIKLACPCVGVHGVRVYHVVVGLNTRQKRLRPAPKRPCQKPSFCLSLVLRPKKVLVLTASKQIFGTAEYQTDMGL